MILDVLKRLRVFIVTSILMTMFVGSILGSFSLPWKVYLRLWGQNILGPFAVIPSYPPGSLGGKMLFISVWAPICLALIIPHLIRPSKLTAVSTVVGVLLWYLAGLMAVGYGV